MRKCCYPPGNDPFFQLRIFLHIHSHAIPHIHLIIKCSYNAQNHQKDLRARKTNKQRTYKNLKTKNKKTRNRGMPDEKDEFLSWL
jgi:hypothetical protein